MTTAPQTVHRGIVKQVLSGDAVIIRGQPRGGPPPERQVCLSNITAPRLGRRPQPGVSEETKDEPYAWEAREFLRKKLVGKEVAFSIEYSVPGSATGREYGCIYLGRDNTAESVTDLIVAEGLAEVRRGGINQEDPKQQRLIALEEAAKAASKGKWGPAEDAMKHVRNITWTIESPRHFVDSHHGKPVDAVIEHVRDGCTVRAFVMPSFTHVTVMLTGIKCPMFKIDGDKTVPEAFAQEAKFFTESRLLQRDVQIVLEGVSNQNLLGTVIHPNGNIAELLVKEGFGRCVDWSMGKVSQGSDKLRAAEKIAKEKKLRLWKDYVAKAATDIKDKNFTAKVVEIINGDGMMVKLSDGASKKIFLASVRSPRPRAVEDSEKPSGPKGRTRPLYDIPYMFEAREYLRKKLIGKKVQVLVDYIQPESDGYPEKVCCTVTISGANIAEALISKGLGHVVRYRMDDDQRSSQYDDLLKAEDRAEKKAVGVHSKKDPPVLRFADVSGDAARARSTLPSLQRAGRVEAVVEFVASGSRLRLFIPKETCLITFLLAGIECPRASRPDPQRPGSMMPAEPFGDEAQAFTKDLIMQKEVLVEVENIDKGGNFIGYLTFEGTNLSVALIEEGFAAMHFTAEKSNHFRALQTAEDKAKNAKKKRWANFEEPTETKVTQIEEPQERTVNFKNVLVTEIGSDLKFYAQSIDNLPQLEKLMEQLKGDMETNPPLAGSYKPRKGDLCCAKFSIDNQWYRARVEKVDASGVYVTYIDYGNREKTDSTKVATLPAAYNTLPPQAAEYTLACINLPADDEDKNYALDQFYNDVYNKKCSLNVEYKREGLDHVVLLHTDSKDDAGMALISEGLVLAENRKEKRLQKLVKSYLAAQDKAKNARLNLWLYGDFTEDDAKEFGYRG